MVKVSMMRFMSEDEIGKIRDELKAYKEQLDSLKQDMEIVIRFANPYLIGQVNQYATGVRADPVVAEKCRKFVQRYRLPSQSDFYSSLLFP
jgi:hypothetical protein